MPDVPVNHPNVLELDLPETEGRDAADPLTSPDGPGESRRDMLEINNEVERELARQGFGHPPEGKRHPLVRRLDGLGLPRPNGPRSSPCECGATDNP